MRALPVPKIILPDSSVGSTVEVVSPKGHKLAVAIPGFLPTKEYLDLRRKILSSQFFLVRQGGKLGEILRCGRCKGKHKHLTLMCVERPFDGLRNGLFAYYQTAGRTGAENFFSPEEMDRYEAIRKALHIGTDDLAKSHPRFARSLNVPEGDIDIGAIAVGILEPISKAKAKALSWTINARGIKPKFVLEGLRKEDV